MDKQIIYWYRRGVASYLIAKKFKVSNNYVRTTLEKHGIKLRGHSVTNKISASRRTPEENKRITEKAAEANIGSIHSSAHRAKLALSRQKNPTIDPVYEKPLVELCNKLKIEVVPQKAFSKFNVDLYLPQKGVVIEIFGGGFHNKQDAIDLFNNKMKHLSSKQVPVVIVWADKLTYSPMSVLEVALNAKDKLTIINGDGKPTTRGLNDILINN